MYRTYDLWKYFVNVIVAHAEQALFVHFDDRSGYPSTVLAELEVLGKLKIIDSFIWQQTVMFFNKESLFCCGIANTYTHNGRWISD